MFQNTNDGVSLWQDQASCAQSNTELFFSDEKTAKTFCHSCPVRSDCLDYALIYHVSGVWGGTSDRERSRMYSRTYVNDLRDDYEESGMYEPRLRL